MNKILAMLCALSVFVTLVGCAKTETAEVADEPTPVVEESVTEEPLVEEPDSTRESRPQLPEISSEELAEILAEEAAMAEATQEAEAVAIEETEAEAEEPEVEEVPAEPAYVVVIDPGHQGVGNYSTEPLGPGSSEMKIKVSGGTSSPFTGTPEYILTLEASLALEAELLSRGYTVIMTRYSHDVDISNIERAEIANENNADVYIRIHANGSDSASANGAMTICPTANSPYCPQIYADSKSLSEFVLDAYCEKTGIQQTYIWETDTMCGINWSQVPVTIVEMGFMTNQSDDALMADPAFQLLMAEGMADGIDNYLANKSATIE
ncbi:MAG: N-acetylmuramoyl-L-alanine amidase [Eubacteriales bacterium]